MLNKLPTREERVAGAYVGASMKSHFLSIFLFSHQFLPTGSRLTVFYWVWCGFGSENAILQMKSHKDLYGGGWGRRKGEVPLLQTRLFLRSSPSLGQKNRRIIWQFPFFPSGRGSMKNLFMLLLCFRSSHVKNNQKWFILLNRFRKRIKFVRLWLSTAKSALLWEKPWQTYKGKNLGIFNLDFWVIFDRHLSRFA